MNKVTREDIIKMIIDERINNMSNFDNSDIKKTKNDWCGTAAYYLFEGSSKRDKHVSFDEFRKSLIKTSAVLLAALETSFALENDSTMTELLDKLENSKIEKQFPTDDHQ